MVHWPRSRRRPPPVAAAATDTPPEARPPSDTRPSVEADLDVPSDVVLLAFGGLQGNIGMPPFEFFRIAEGVPAKRLFVRDLRQAWYHLGIGPQVGTFFTMVAEVGGLVDGSGAHRLVIVGNSLGGYAALAAGHLLGADVVHAFSPQTFLSADLRHQHGDDRWAEQLARVQHRRPPVAPELLDLRLLLAGDRPPSRRGEPSAPPRVHVHHGLDHPLDSAHAHRLAGLPGVELHAYPDADHDLVRLLRTDGRLRPLLEQALA